MPRLDRLTVVLAVPLLVALALPAFSFRPNRIAPPQPRALAEVFGPAGAGAMAGVVILLVAALLLVRRPALRAALVVPVLAGVFAILGAGAALLIQGGVPAARVSPGSGMWLAFGSLVLLLVDTLSRLKPATGTRALLLVAAIGAMGLVLYTGVLADLSIAAEFRARANAFRHAAGDHAMLVFGSVLAAMLVGLPAGVLIQRRRSLRDPVLNLLTLVQTIPSIALFGMLIVPLAWVAAHVPGAAAAGVRGIGMAPALVALFLYSLLPIVANTVAGLDGVPRAVKDAAAGVGMTPRGQLWSVELPLALPVILTGVRIVLVQNIGLATIGALIGSGGFGIFIFQGIGQTATDLILLGVVPIVAMAFVASAAMDILIAVLGGKVLGGQRQ